MSGLLFSDLFPSVWTVLTITTYHLSSHKTGNQGASQTIYVKVFEPASVQTMSISQCLVEKIKTVLFQEDLQVNVFKTDRQAGGKVMGTALDY